MKRLSCIIVTYNSEAHIFDCIKSLYQFNDIGDDLEVIVVDNCSKEFETMRDKIIALYGGKVKVIANIRNGGYGQGNNVGIRAAEAPIIMIMNPDVRLNIPMFGKVISAFDAEKSVVMYGLKQYLSEGAPGKSLGWTTRCNPYFCEPMRYILCKLDVYWQRYMFFSGSCFFVRKTSLETAGLFDENMFMYCEEEDIHGRLLKLGKVKFIYNKALSCLHLHGPVCDYSEEDYGWMDRNLDSLLYMDGRDGISPRTTLQRAIGRTNISIICTRDKSKKDYFRRWKVELEKRIKSL